MATINTARHYRLRNFGAIAPRYWADFVVFEDLQKPVIQQTYKRGLLVAEAGKYFGPPARAASPPRSTMNLKYDPEALVVKNGTASSSRLHIIEIVPHQIVTKRLTLPPRIVDGRIVPDLERDILKLVVVERHRATGNVGVGFVRGFKLKQGALGSTVAHDAHNVVVVGTNDSDIEAAIQALVRLQGGQVVVAHGQIKAALALPIAGLVSDQPLETVVQQTEALNAAARALGCELDAPFMTLSFLSLSPIPELKLTDQGLIDSTHLRLANLLE
jgi:adenine deaminase